MVEHVSSLLDRVHIPRVHYIVSPSILDTPQVCRSLGSLRQPLLLVVGLEGQRADFGIHVLKQLLPIALQLCDAEISS